MDEGVLMKLPVLVVILFWTVLSAGQSVQVSSEKGAVTLSVSAQKAYEIMASEKKTPVLTVQCSQKGKKMMHLVTFSPGGAVAEDKAENAPRNGEIWLDAVVNGKKRVTSWIPYGDTITFAYYGKSEPERIQFLQLLLDSPSFSIEFTPFLTGNPITSTFDLSQLREELNNHPECAMQ